MNVVTSAAFSGRSKSTGRDYDPTHFEGFLFGPLKHNSVQEEHPSKYPYPGSVPDEILKTGDSFYS